MTDIDPTGACGCEDVCSLPADQLQDRLTTLRREIVPHVKRHTPMTEGMAFEFANTPVMRKTLEDLVAFERECCSGLTWNLGRLSDQILQLSVQGLPPDSDFYRIFGDPVGEGTAARLPRLARAGGLGAMVALVVGCVAPVAGTSIFGAAIASRFAILEDPLVIASGAVLFAIPAWLWLKRRAEPVAASGCGTNC